MSEHDGQERTEQPTPKRRREALQRGQVARSRELTTLALLGSAAGALALLGPAMLDAVLDLMRDGLAPDPARIRDAGAGPAAAAEAIHGLLWALAPFLALMVLVAAIAPLALGGWTFSSRPLGFKWERIDPLKGVKRIFGLRALIEMVKAMAKFGVIAIVAMALLWASRHELLGLGLEPLLPALGHAASLVSGFFLILVLPLALVAAIDVPFQLYEHTRRLRMTRREVKDEVRDTEGKPEIRSRIRRLQEEMARRRMMAKVPESDVVVTNPSHYAVALAYRPESMAAPVVTAVGADLVAAHIRGLAESHRVPLVESPLLARALYFNAELDQPIPVGLYVAVAQVLAYVFQLRRDAAYDGSPLAMHDLPVPPEVRTE